MFTNCFNKNTSDYFFSLIVFGGPEALFLFILPCRPFLIDPIFLKAAGVFKLIPYGFKDSDGRESSHKRVSEFQLYPYKRSFDNFCIWQFFADFFIKLPMAFGNPLLWVIAAFRNFCSIALLIFRKICRNYKVLSSEPFEKICLKFLNKHEQSKNMCECINKQSWTLSSHCWVGALFLHSFGEAVDGEGIGWERDDRLEIYIGGTAV